MRSATISNERSSSSSLALDLVSRFLLYKYLLVSENSAYLPDGVTDVENY
jgi:hypothetical protein